MPDNTKKISKEVKYAGRDFDSLKKGLIEFARTYYPNTYNDFNEASPGMMFVEMAAYVGDTLNYYIDSQFKESMILHATEPRSILSIASALGYKPKLSIPSVVDLDVYQLLPPSGSGTAVVPDMRYALNIEPGMKARSSSSVEFVVNDRINFSIDSVYNPTQISVYSIDSTGAPNYYLAKKTVKAISAKPKTVEIEVGSTKKFFKFLVQDTDLIGIDKIVDSDGHTWYEVPYLAQDTIFESVANTSLNDPDAATYSSETPYLLKLKKVPRRFITRIVEKGIEVQFGAGTSTSADEELIPIPENIGLSLPTGKTDIDASIDPTSPVFTGAYGISPSNTTLTVTYYVGGGVKSNVPSNTISEIIGIDTSNTNLPPNTPTLNSTVFNSVAINNYSAAGGGRSMETMEEVRQNALMQFTTQNRAVTREDYIIRAYSMPSLYGSVSKVYIAPDEQNNIQSSEVGDKVSNPLAMNMYMLGYDDNKNLTQVNHAVKENLKTYLSQYRMLTDSINFRDAFIVNIEVNFDIIPFPNVNAHEVLLNCIQAAKDFFAIDKWQINQPIVYSDVFNALIQVQGVQTVTGVKFKNLNDSTLQYSPIAYDLQDATKNGIIYPSLDPCIFEVKFPNNDIKGRIATY